MGVMQASQTIQAWPEESKEAAQLVVKQYGEPDEVTETQLTWRKPGPWKRIVASKTFYLHNFSQRRIPIPLSRLSIIGCPCKNSRRLPRFDGSVIAERTAGEVSARCDDEQANFLALNLMHDILTGVKGVQEAREYYGKEFADYRRKKPTPYMERLRFSAPQEKTADPDIPILSDDDLKEAEDEGKKRDNRGQLTIARSEQI